MIKVGDKVKINIGALEESGFPDKEVDTQVAAYQHILDHPDGVYVVANDKMQLVAACIELDHEVLGKTSFFRSELIKVGDSE